MAIRTLIIAWNVVNQVLQGLLVARLLALAQNARHIQQPESRSGL